jgi:uncharacterized protein (DUF433 family)
MKYIISDPNIMMGKPVISGTRITVEFILEKLSSGETISMLLKEYPHLSEEAIKEALAFAAQVLKSDIVYPAQKIS